MIRRDYILRAIEECVQALARILKLTRDGEIAQARNELDRALQALAGLDLTQACTLSDTELMAALLKDEPTQALREKGLLLVALLERAGELYAAQSRLGESRTCFMRALRLQLQILTREGTFDLPSYVPRVEALAQVVQEQAPVLPVDLSLALMQYFERTGQFGKAEDIFFAAMESQEDKSPWLEFGRQFYARLLRQPDFALEMGNLPRAEVESGLADLELRRAE